MQNHTDSVYAPTVTVSTVPNCLKSQLRSMLQCHPQAPIFLAPGVFAPPAPLSATAQLPWIPEKVEN